MNSPFFTVVIPLYNKEPHIERALKSVFSQTNSDWELILVNDASTDKGPLLASRIIESDSRCRILERSIPGQGGYAARNYAAREAKGTWLAFLDADDEWTPEHLDNLLDLIHQYTASYFVCSGVDEIMPDGRTRNNAFRMSVPSSHPLILDLLSYVRTGSNGLNPVFTSACALEKNFFFSIGAFPEGIFGRGGDRDTWLRAVSATSLAWTPFPSALYHRDAVNMVTKTVPFKLQQCCDSTIDTILADSDRMKNNRGLERALKRLANYERKGTIRKRINEGNVSLEDARILYRAVEPIYWFYVFFCAIIPKRLLSFILHLVKRI